MTVTVECNRPENVVEGACIQSDEKRELQTFPIKGRHVFALSAAQASVILRSDDPIEVVILKYFHLKLDHSGKSMFTTTGLQLGD